MLTQRFFENMCRGILDPSIPLRMLWRILRIGPFELREKFDAIDRPYYAFGVYHAAKLAKAIGLKSVSVIEFGVAKGDGLVNLQEISSEVSKIFNIAIEVYGFDSGGGLPPPADYKDLPYIWRGGDFRMDFSALKQRLTSGQLLIGDVKETVPGFPNSHNPAPIGFVSFDLDYYSSTKSALKIFSYDDIYLLPRVLCYFDDVLDENAVQLFNEHSGELLALNEFNNEFVDKKICKVNGLSKKRYLKSSWPEAVYAMHSFNHPLYNKYIL